MIVGRQKKNWMIKTCSNKSKKLSIRKCTFNTPSSVSHVTGFNKRTFNSSHQRDGMSQRASSSASSPSTVSPASSGSSSQAVCRELGEKFPWKPFSVRSVTMTDFLGYTNQKIAKVLIELIGSGDRGELNRIFVERVLTSGGKNGTSTFFLSKDWRSIS